MIESVGGASRTRWLREWKTVLLAGILATWPILAAVPEPDIPQGRLPDTAIPQAYRLDMTIVPEATRFTGHVEVDVILKKPRRSLYLHGQGLAVSSAIAKIPGSKIAAAYQQVDPFGVVRLDFETVLPAGTATLVFDYDAPFDNSAAGLFHLEVGNQWYAWTQFGSIAARSAFPGFDQPGYKTPFSLTVTTRSRLIVYGNAPETDAVQAGSMVKHIFAPTRPLPTYLVAFGVGPFAIASTVVPPTAQRPVPLPVRVLATQANKGNLDFALRNTGPIVQRLEEYFGQPFPFPKLDQVATPMLEGAMENAGADTYNDQILMLKKDASIHQKQYFGAGVSHELSHQWFGDLVTPKWWDDVWLNESFADWLGFRIADSWRPDLKIGIEAIDGSLNAMSLDSLKAGRPIYEPIRTNGEIDGAFDGIIYGKGAQVLAMTAAYMGQDKFREAVRRHLEAHAYQTASTDEFFKTLADVAHDPGILAAFKTFVNQQGVPQVRLERNGDRLRVSQTRYALLGSELEPEIWAIPLCMRIGSTRQCTLLDGPEATLNSFGSGVIMPNAGGTGYYRFSLSEPDWHALIAQSANLPPGEALAMTDSLWAGFRDGELPPTLLIEGARMMVANPSSEAVAQVGRRLIELRTSGMIRPAELNDYRRFIGALYRPVLARLGFDPRAGVYASEDPDRQKLRSDVIALLSGEARDESVRSQLIAATSAWLAGDQHALDPGLVEPSLEAYVTSGDTSVGATLLERALSRDDSTLRIAVTDALAGSGEAKIGTWLIAHFDDQRLRSRDKSYMLESMMKDNATLDAAFAWMLAHFDEMVRNADIFTVPILLRSATGFCSIAKADEIDAALRPKALQYKRGTLPLDRIVEQGRDCGVLLKKRGAEISQALRAASG